MPIIDGSGPRFDFFVVLCTEVLLPGLELLPNIIWSLLSVSPDQRRACHRLNCIRYMYMFHYFVIKHFCNDNFFTILSCIVKKVDIIQVMPIQVNNWLLVRRSDPYQDDTSLFDCSTSRQTSRCKKLRTGYFRNDICRVLGVDLCKEQIL